MNSHSNNRVEFGRDESETADERSAMRAQEPDVEQTTQAFEALIVSGSRAPLTTREEEIMIWLVEIKEQYEIAESCRRHCAIIQHSLQRNLELMELYSAFNRDAAGSADERLRPTCELYRRLGAELEETNRKLSDLEQSLAARSSMNMSGYELQSQRLNEELEMIRRQRDQDLAE
jgi:hypothetical protein